MFLSKYKYIRKNIFHEIFVKTVLSLCIFSLLTFFMWAVLNPRVGRFEPTGCMFDPPGAEAAVAIESEGYWMWRQKTWRWMVL